MRMWETRTQPGTLKKPEHYLYILARNIIFDTFKARARQLHHQPQLGELLHDSDQPRVKATLVTGKVNIRSGKAEAILIPGQEASIAGDITVADHADINKAIAWKNGAFDFNNITIEELATQLERWYDIEVTYDHHISRVPFGGKISRKVSLKTLVLLMDGTGLNFRLTEDRKLIITERK